LLETPENKLLQRLLDSPMAQEMLRSENASLEAVRKRAKAEMERITSTKAEVLATKARALRDAAAAAKAAYERANLEAEKAAYDANIERESAVHKRISLQRLADASEGWLRGNGINSVADLEAWLKSGCWNA
jgi:hypothetical protein